MNSFLEALSGRGAIEINTLNRTHSSLASVHLETDNVFFLAGLKEGLSGRASDEDVLYKKYIAFDIDVRSNTTMELSDNEIKELGEELGNHLKESFPQTWGTWKYIVFSGNGLHIYYVGKELEISKDISVDEWSLAVGYLYKQWEKDMEWDLLYSPDYACRNVGRIMRLPGTTNQKNGVLVSIIAQQDIESPLLSWVPALAKKATAEKERKQEERRKDFEEQMKKYSADENNLFNTILKIPAWQISQLLLPQFPLSENGRNFYSGNNKGNKYTAFFYSEELNCIINGGSRHYNWGDNNSGWDSFQLVKRHKNWTNAQTFEFFRKLLKK